MENKINGIIKQNDSIYNSLVSKNIKFDRIIINNITDLDEKFKLLLEENCKLKEIVKLHKPIQEPKITKSVDNKQNNNNNLNKNDDKKDSKKNKNEDDEDNDNFEDTKKVFNTITNMEDIKRAFFNNELSLFEELVLQHPFKYYSSNYKYNNEKDGSPDYIAKNLLKGFVRNLEDFRKYLFVCFRCNIIDLENKKYEYKSLWIVNSNDSLKDIIGDIYDDFEFNEMNGDNINNNNIYKDFLEYFKKLDIDDDKNKNLINEVYLH